MVNEIVRIKVEEAHKIDENDIKDAILRHFQQACEKKVRRPMWSMRTYKKIPIDLKDFLEGLFTEEEIKRTVYQGRMVLACTSIKVLEYYKR
ncbi:hypothetical protein QJS04_geneDACA021914 [Acorus gramineus]|uniref:Uncharacterized protein n=1 Tax=Acorus gramineus TaxID=55184 RepID=A0AAV9A517_ACOGR|nr:hypothetical protein QJS04_geneDACA021914 [Acorus gramineus]